MGANREGTRARPRALAPTQPRLIRNGHALGFVGPVLSLVSAVSAARALGADGCGASYMNLVQAAAGHTKANPYGVPGLWCNVEDANAWWAQVKAVAGMVTDAARTLQPADVPPGLASFQSMIAELEPPSNFMAFGFGGCGEAVAAYIAAIEKGACMLELVEAAGAKPLVPGIGPVPESPSEKIGDTLSNLALGAGVLLLAFLALKD